MAQDSVLWVVQQSMVEMGLPRPVEAVSNLDATVQQILALLNSAGTDLVLGYPWEQLTKEWVVQTFVGKTDYTLPADWGYFIDQTQWDRTNHWPLLGPKTAQEWQWLKSGILSSGPRIRYRVLGGRFQIFPSNANAGQEGGASSEIAMEYVSRNWVASTVNVGITYDYIQSDVDILLIDPWIVVKFLKLKYWEAKGLDTTAYNKDFLTTWEMRIGKNKGAPILTLAPRARTLLIGVNNIPDGSWNVGNTP